MLGSSQTGHSMIIQEKHGIFHIQKKAKIIYTTKASLKTETQQTVLQKYVIWSR